MQWNFVQLVFSVEDVRKFTLLYCSKFVDQFHRQVEDRQASQLSQTVAMARIWTPRTTRPQKEAMKSDPSKAF